MTKLTFITVLFLVAIAFVGFLIGCWEFGKSIGNVLANVAESKKRKANHSKVIINGSFMCVDGPLKGRHEDVPNGSIVGDRVFLSYGKENFFYAIHESSDTSNHPCRFLLKYDG